MREPLVDAVPVPLGEDAPRDERDVPACDAARLLRTDIVKKSRDHHGSKYRLVPPAIDETRLLPFAGVATPFGVEGL